MTTSTFPDDTIAAIASAPGGAPRGIVRVSGPRVVSIVEHLLIATDGRSLVDVRQPTVVRGQIKLPGFHSLLDADLYLWPGTRSYTRQPTAEIHTIGSPPLLDAILAALCAAGARPARPGEFTLRAFFAGRLDLTQAEAVLGVIDASSDRELKTALNQLGGGLATPLHRLRDNLLDVLAHLEAGLDFVEEDIEFITPAELDAHLAGAATIIAELLAQMAGRIETTDLPRVVLVGRPNIGKSSLFNALQRGHLQQRSQDSFSLGRATDDAIVSNISGTTRDYLVTRVDLGGMACELVDTAGIEHCSIAAESSAAQTAANEQHAEAHVQLLCLDATRPLDAWEEDQLAKATASPRLVVWTKADAAIRPAQQIEISSISTSSLTGAGLDRLRGHLRDLVVAARISDNHVVSATATRCRESLRLAKESIDRARELVGQAGEELVASDIRIALDALGEVVGAVYTDDILDRVFSRFCIGK